ncbi:uncharacterized protein LY79DRAFT_543231 [Colletotrichum navitas]|uniref:Uncharacterized protein n=1 Tax=Colletotrichum navitas TaxID=681940 RepID=A0AAD8Q6R7_9PEZI|nr:uncharacterized protein LY79DRAFT_543231 [Colletotrichum navitas]KAK1596948.1 hypothetical protein LY79DRAFT_543231 [Colletotrichum navitas]
MPPNPVRAPGGWLNLGDIGKASFSPPSVPETSLQFCPKWCKSPGFGRVSGGIFAPVTPWQATRFARSFISGCHRHAGLARFARPLFTIPSERRRHIRVMASAPSREVAGSLEMRYKHGGARQNNGGQHFNGYPNLLRRRLVLSRVQRVPTFQLFSLSEARALFAAVRGCSPLSLTWTWKN